MLLIGASPGMAQAATGANPENPADKSPTTADTLTLDAIVVTARKKSEALQKVPMSVVALDAEDQKKLGIDSLTDLADYVPGLQQGDLAITSRLTLRGVNS